MARKTRRDWLEAGLDVLAKDGESGLTVDALLAVMSVTKGSFYHHFRDRQEFVQLLLEYWEEKMTEEFIRISNRENGPVDRLRKLTDLTVGRVNQKLEIAIRNWAGSDTVARKYQAKVDKKRLAYCKQLCSEITADQSKADVLGRLMFTVFVGSQQICPPIKGKALREMYGELQKLYDQN
ncbi:MAG: TetR/AcrR family transcriptional regulator [Pseudomonadota bacterium]